MKPRMNYYQAAPDTIKALSRAGGADRRPPASKNR